MLNVVLVKAVRLVNVVLVNGKRWAAYVDERGPSTTPRIDNAVSGWRETQDLVTQSQNIVFSVLTTLMHPAVTIFKYKNSNKQILSHPVANHILSSF